MRRPWHRAGAVVALLFPPVALRALLAVPTSLAPSGPAESLAFTALRAGAIALAAWATAATVLGLLARVVQAPSMVRWADLVTAPPIRRALDVVVSAAIVSGAMAPVAAAAQSAPPIMQRLDTADVPGDEVPRADGAGEHVVPTPPTTWTIGPGHHLWLVAERTLTESWGRAPTDAEIVPFWRALIELNRGRLAHRDNPDLVFAGQVMALPPVPSPPTASQ